MPRSTPIINAIAETKVPTEIIESRVRQTIAEPKVPNEVIETEVHQTITETEVPTEVIEPRVRQTITEPKVPSEVIEPEVHQIIVEPEVFEEVIETNLKAPVITETHVPPAITETTLSLNGDIIRLSIEQVQTLRDAVANIPELSDLYRLLPE